MTLHDLFTRRDPARPYDLSRVEAGDEILIGYPHGFTFRAIVRSEPADFECDCIDQDGIQMTVPATLILSHRERGVWQEGRAA